METMNISLPENLKGFVDSRVKAGGYSSVSEYVRDLVREDQKRHTQENLEALLLEATRSGPGREFTKAERIFGSVDEAHAEITLTSYLAKTGSAVRIGSFSACACPIRSRSNGSR